MAAKTRMENDYIFGLITSLFLTLVSCLGSFYFSREGPTDNLLERFTINFTDELTVCRGENTKEIR